MSDKIQTLKGFRDFLPEEMAIRRKVINAFEKVFRSFGFEPLETPALEYASVLLGKYGKEADKLVYTFKDKGGREVGLRYDLTVPTARFLAQYWGRIPLPFKRYQIQPVWRADKPQRGRYREFTQCDIDIFGSGSPLADAEIIALAYFSLKKLGFEKFKIRINSRPVLFNILESAGIKEKNNQLPVIQTIDKLDKKPKEEVVKELEEKGFSTKAIKKIFGGINKAQPDDFLQQVFDMVDDFGVDRNYYEFDPTLVRGLDYYTGPIFEAVVEKPKIGSIAGGGRYDKLISQLGGPDIPATGTTIGLDRICDVISELDLFKEEFQEQPKFLITVFNKKLLQRSLQVFSLLREEGISSFVFPDPKKDLNAQLSYANRKGIRFVLIVGPKEAKKSLVILKNMKTGDQTEIKQKNLIFDLKKII